MGTVVLLVMTAVIVAVVVAVALARRPDPAVEGTAGAAALDALGGRARVSGMPVVSLDRRSDEHLLVMLGDGTALDVFLFWPRPTDPARLLDVRWWDPVGWALEFELVSGESQPFYAWRCRISEPTPTSAA